MTTSRTATFAILVLAAALAACVSSPRPGSAAYDYDLVIRNGVVHDGSGGEGRRIDVGVRGDRVAALGDLAGASARHVVDARGRAVAPGFINMLSWATESLLVDSRGLSDTKQGVTLEVFGEGWSMGPLNETMKRDAIARQGDVRYEIDWTTLGEYLDRLVARGVTPNVASFVGATTVRIHELGHEARDPTPEELRRMQALVRDAMREGALGVGSSLIYAPAFYAKTSELAALAKVAGDAGGGYISHIRNESYGIEEAIDELIAIAKAGGGRGEIYHLKAAGEANWPRMRAAIAKVDMARAQGLPIGANMYTYPAGATGLDAAMPTWVQEGGLDAWIERLKDPQQRARVIADIRNPPPGEENLYRQAGSAARVKFIGFRNPKLKRLTGMTLAQVARERGTSPEDTIVDLVIEDRSRVDTVYFLMSEENVALGIAQPWVAFGSDAEASAPEGVFLKSSTHPRAYGNFARLFAKYVREERVLTVGEAVRRLTRLPAENWKLSGRGCIDPGCWADIVVFDPDTIQDHATFDRPQQLATGVSDVWVNGVQVLRDGEHTGAKPGRVVRGPGYAPR